MEKKGAVLSQNMAVGKEIEMSLEKQRFKLGLVSFMRKDMINRMYGKAPKVKSCMN